MFSPAVLSVVKSAGVHITQNRAQKVFRRDGRASRNDRRVATVNATSASRDSRRTGPGAQPQAQGREEVFDYSGHLGRRLTGQGRVCNVVHGLSSDLPGE